MATNFPKINESDYADKGVRLLPDRPAVESAVLKREFDELSLDVIIPTFNALIAVLQNSYGEMPDDVKKLLDMIGNVGGLTAKYFNRTADTEWNSTISNVDDIPVNWCGYVYTAMGAATEGFLICFGFPHHACKVQINISLYGGKVFYRYLSGTAWSEWVDLAKTTDLAKYFPLTGGYVDGNVVPKTDSTKVLGTDTLAWLAVYANQFNLLKGGQSYGSIKVMSEGTESTLGYTQLTLGNATSQGTNKNSRGQIVLYGTGTGFVQITPTNSGSETIEVKLPSAGGSLIRKENFYIDDDGYLVIDLDS